MTEPQMMVLGGKRGRRPRAGVRSTVPKQFYVTEDEAKELRRVATEAGKTEAEIFREAVNEFVSDYGEKKPFREVG